MEKEKPKKEEKKKIKLDDAIAYASKLIRKQRHHEALKYLKDNGFLQAEKTYRSQLEKLGVI